MFYWNRTGSALESRVRAYQPKLQFVPLAILLLVLSLPPLCSDLLRSLRRKAKVIDQAS
ncbi:MAG: hypothetical protein Q7K20_07055 [Polaromonas sp.]|nr:hypothetical protein [Polaromonas sp.]